MIRLLAALLRAIGLLAARRPNFVRFAVPRFFPRNPMERDMISINKTQTGTIVPLEFFRDDTPLPAPDGGRVEVIPTTGGTAELTADGVTFTRGERAGRVVVRYTNVNIADLVAELSIDVEAAVIEPPPPPPPLVPNRVVFAEDRAVNF